LLDRSSLTSRLKQRGQSSRRLRTDNWKLPQNEIGVLRHRGYLHGEAGLVEVKRDPLRRQLHCAVAFDCHRERRRSDAAAQDRLLLLAQRAVYAEFARATNLDRWFLVADPYGPLGRDLREWGYYVAAVQNLGRHFRLGLRYDYYNPDLDSTDRQAAVTVPSSQDISTVSAAVALVGKTAAFSGRLVAEYDWISDHQGRNVSGLPTDLRNNAFTLRAEVAF